MVVVELDHEPVAVRADEGPAAAVEVARRELHSVADGLCDVRAAGDRHVDGDHDLADPLRRALPAAACEQRQRHEQNSGPAHARRLQALRAEVRPADGFALADLFDRAFGNGRAGSEDDHPVGREADEAQVVLDE